MSNPEVEGAIYWLSWINTAKIIGALLVAIGVTTEFVGEFIGRPLERKIEAEREKEIARLSTEAEAAKSEIAKANAEAAEANARAAEATLALAKFKAPRTLSREQQERIASKLKPFTGQEYKVTPFWDIKESLNIANRIHQALSIGGWKYLEHGKGGSVLVGAITGVLVYIHPGATDQTKRAAATLISALNDEEIVSELREQNAPDNPNNIIYLNIGTKP